MAENSAAPFTLRPFTDADYDQVRSIFERGLDTGHATFEQSGFSLEEFRSTKIMDLVFVAEEESGRIIGWVSAAPVSGRRVFSGVIEDSVYIDPEEGGRGIAGALLDRLIEEATAKGKWAMHAWIFPENEGSARLHASRGYEQVATFHHMAKMPYGERAHEWRDTNVWEKLLPKPDIDVEKLP